VILVAEEEEIHRRGLGEPTKIARRLMKQGGGKYHRCITLVILVAEEEEIHRRGLGEPTKIARRLIKQGGGKYHWCITLMILHWTVHVTVLVN
jgi:hypothetical protein